MRDKFGTTQHSTEHIGELCIEIPAAYQDGLRTKAPYFARLAAVDFEVKIEFVYTPGEPGKLDGPLEDAVEPIPAAVEIRAIRAASNVLFDGDGVVLTACRGTDLLQLFTHAQISALEDRLLARAMAGSLE